jgi:hypothetical protein
MKSTTKTNSRLMHGIVSENIVSTHVIVNKNYVTVDLEIISENYVTADLEIVSKHLVMTDQWNRH